MRDVDKLLMRSRTARAAANDTCRQSRLARADSASVRAHLLPHRMADDIAEQMWIGVLDRFTRLPRH